MREIEHGDWSQVVVMHANQLLALLRQGCHSAHSSSALHQSHSSSNRFLKRLEEETISRSSYRVAVIFRR